MNRNETDLIAGGLIASIIVLSVLAALTSLQADGEMTTGGWVGLVGLILAGTLGIGYILTRDRFVSEDVSKPDVPAPTDQSDSVVADSDASEGTDADAAKETPERPAPVAPDVRERILVELPEDERKIYAPIIESPGLTQVDVRDESGFSKSKVSQTVNDLEDRGMLYRERDGRTFRIYPTDDLEDRLPSS